jgi:Zn-dependent protease with chaperone function
VAELVFPIAAVAFTFLVLVPLLALLSRAVLSRRRRLATTWSDFGSAGTFAWLVAPTFVPVAWLISAALHQLEPAPGADPCVTNHVSAEACFDVALLVTFVAIGLFAVTSWRAWRERPQLRLDRTYLLAPASRRVRELVARDPALRGLRVDVVGGAPAPVFSLDLLRPRVVVDACFVTDSDDEVLRAALLHERAHIDGRDPLRGFVARLGLALNPVGGWLAPDYERWRRAREAQCDGEAVAWGGQPLALAHGILHAARFRCAGHLPEGATALCGHDATALRLRLALLLDGPPRPRRSLGHLVLAVALIAALTTPHIDGFGLLEVFHSEVERLVHGH